MSDRTLSPSDVAEAAASVVAIAADRVNAAEADRRLDRDVVAAVVDAGFARHFVPEARGGRAGNFGDLLRAVAEVGETCPSTAWFASLTASLGRMCAFLPEEGQNAVWADGPDPIVVGALMPLGRAVATGGGWRLTGRWPYVSGVDFADWALLCGAPDNDPSELRFFAVPRCACSIEETWFNVGMQATGSNTLVLDDVQVPLAFSFARADAVAGNAIGSTAPCHTAPLKAVNGLSFAAPVLGAARGALRSWTRYTDARRGAAPARRDVAPSYRVTLARADGEVDVATMLLERAASIADCGDPSPLLTARSSRDCAFAVELLVQATDRVFHAGGTGAQSSANALQRFWRDIHAAASHVVLQYEPAAKAYAGALRAALRT